MYLNFQVKETLETGLKDRQTFGTPLEINTKKIHIFNYIWPPTKKPQNNMFYIAAGHRYFNSSIKTKPL